MANWRQLAMSALLADGTIDEREVEILRKEFFADRRIDRAEMEFLLEARRKAGSAAPSFEKLIFEALRSIILADGVISPEETEWVRQYIFADGKVDAAEKHWLTELKCLADSVCPEFLALYNQCMASCSAEDETMADWKKTAKAFLLADGGIDDREVVVLRKELFADGVVDDIEMDFLLELRRDAKRLVPAFHFLVIDALKSCCLEGDTIKHGSVSLLRRWLLPGKVGYVEKRYLEELRAAARQVPADFDELYRQCVSP